MTDPWQEWAQGVLTWVEAPWSMTNLETLRAWSRMESGADLMRWNNPLNTTLVMPGIPPNPQNSVGVQAYPSIQTGIAATGYTLRNGRYSGIIDHLQRSVPAAEWGDVCAELETWGTGCGWLEGAEMTPDDFRAVLNEATGSGQASWADTVRATLSKLEALTNAVAGEGADLAAAKGDLEQLLQHPGAGDPAVKALLQQLAAHLGLGTA